MPARPQAESSRSSPAAVCRQSATSSLWPAFPTSAPASSAGPCSTGPSIPPPPARVAINTAAIRKPQLTADCAREFGVQAVVLSCDAKRVGDGWRATMRSGKELTELDAVEWCRRAEELGTGEILLTSVDRDGTNSGFDVELLRAVTGVVKIN